MANLSNINNKFLVTTGGNVGINTTSPGQKLVVTGNIATSGSVLFDDNQGINFGNSNAKIYGSSSDGIKFNAGGSEGMRFNQSGNLGIGVTGPTAKLHIGVSSANDDTFHIFNGSIRTHLLGSESSNGVIYLRSSVNSNKVRINTSGDSYFNGGTPGNRNGFA